MTNLEVLDMIFMALRRYKHDARIDDVTYDNDNDSGEIVLTTVDGQNKKQIWIISSKDVREINDEAQED